MIMKTRIRKTYLWTQKKKKNSVLSNSTSPREGFLQTLTIHRRSNNKMKYIRVLIKSGSTKCHLSTFTLAEMRYCYIVKENLTYSWFCCTDIVLQHKKYVIRLRDFFDNNCFSVEMLDEENICSGILKMSRVSLSKIKK